MRKPRSTKADKLSALLSFTTPKSKTDANKAIIKLGSLDELLESHKEKLAVQFARVQTEQHWLEHCVGVCMAVYTGTTVPEGKRPDFSYLEKEDADVE